MQPSSLIFLVIIGVWAVFLGQVWIRRREHLHTARTVDALTESLRVLRRRDPVSVGVSVPEPRSYAVSPARARRAVLTSPAAGETGLARVAVEMGSMDRMGSTMAMSAAGSGSGSGFGSGSGSAPRPPRPGRDEGPLRAARAGVASPVRRPSARMRPARSVRGLALLTLLLGTVLFAALGAVGVLRAWAFVLPLLGTVGAFAWLRAGVQSEIRARRAARVAARRRRPMEGEVLTGAPVPAASRPAAGASRPATGATLPDVAATAAAVAPTAPTTASAATEESAIPAPYDISAVEAASAPAPAARSHPQRTASRAVPEVDEDDIPLTWDPRPVPRPTYTMKAAAYERPAPDPVVDETVESEPEQPAAVRPRRASGG